MEISFFDEEEDEDEYNGSIEGEACAAMLSFWVAAGRAREERERKIKAVERLLEEANGS